MLKQRLFAFAFSIVVGTGVVSEANASTLLDSTNASSTLANGIWQAVDMGFLYTPASPYTLDGVATKFSYLPPSGIPTVTVEIFSGLPGSLSLLSSGTLTPVAANSFATASMSPVALTGGTTYFVGFENITGLGSNFSLTGLTTTGYYYDYGGKTFLNPYGPGNNPYTFPGLGVVSEFFGTADTTVTPLPAALPLFATGLGALGLLGWRRKRKAAAQAA
jgi:hypothetical protein